MKERSILKSDRRLIVAFLSIAILLVCGCEIDCYEEVHPDYQKVDVASLIHIHSAKDAQRMRQDIIEYLWSPKAPPAEKMPAKVTSESPPWQSHIGSSNIASVERLDIQMDYGLRSIAYLFQAKVDANRLLIFHQGHCDDILSYGGKETIRFFLDKGFSVLTFWMPLCGENNKPVNIPGKGLVVFEGRGSHRHNELADLLQGEKGSFIRFFIEPVVVAINFLEKNFNYHDINMTGISGGGWTTNICAAIEPRISYSFSVAGSVPLYLRKGPCSKGSRGDAEQWWPGLYKETASYLDLYILGGFGQGRKLFQIYNKYDPCCFYGNNYRTFVAHVSEATNKIGQDSFRVYLDDTHREHKISQTVIEEVIWPALAAREFENPVSTGTHGKRKSFLKDPPPVFLTGEGRAHLPGFACARSPSVDLE